MGRSRKENVGLHYRTLGAVRANQWASNSQLCLLQKAAVRNRDAPPLWCCNNHKRWLSAIITTCLFPTSKIYSQKENRFSEHQDLWQSAVEDKHREHTKSNLISSFPEVLWFPTEKELRTSSKLSKRGICQIHQPHHHTSHWSRTPMLQAWRSPCRIRANKGSPASILREHSWQMLAREHTSLWLRNLQAANEFTGIDLQNGSLQYSQNSLIKADN